MTQRLGEFELIARYFEGLTPPDPGLRLGIGDDAALLQPPPGQELAITSDTLIQGRHFPDDAAPFDIGWKSLAVNLSDLAAMGAEPRWFTLALSLPEAQAAWLSSFSEGLGMLAREHRVTLVGGDTTRGPLSITITAVGTVPPGQALRRAGAQPGDVVCVTGTLGDAALGLRLHQQPAHEREIRYAPPAGRASAASARHGGPGHGREPRPAAFGGARRAAPEPAADGGRAQQFLWARLSRPEPRVAAGRALRGLAHAAIDLSDGLAGDLGHVLKASGVGATLHADQLPRSPAFAELAPPDQALALQAAGGDDYELCICLPRAQLAEAQRRLDVPLTEIGLVEAQAGLRFVGADGRAVPFEGLGYRHFEGST